METLALMDFLYFINANILLEFCIPAISGFLIWLTVYYFRQTWVENSFILLVFILLPSSIFVITKIISNNIALALGMVGALSIVRFRNPVKNPYELVMYFVLITVGIVFSVNRLYGYCFVFFVILVNISFIISRGYLTKILGITNFLDSNLHSLVVIAKVKIDYSNYINSLSEENSFIENNEYIYRFTSNNKKELYGIKKDLEQKYLDSEIKSLQLSLNE